ncbi:MAG: hypothetical protein J5J00_17460 [Deltaproteobacteria bacterium]|nr:hypothetical protein [Deltaproteobacteria bacterium]
MAIDVEEAYKALAKLTILVICLLALIFLSAGPISVMVFECVGGPGALSHGFGSLPQLCEMYRPFFIMEFITSRAATTFIVAGITIGMSLWIAGLFRGNRALREISIILLAFFFSLSIYNYYSARTLAISDLKKQKQSELLKEIEFRAKCPLRVECFSN